MNPRFRVGDRVRIIHTNHEYTGCRGTIVEHPEAGGDVTLLGHMVAIDGENGLARPFLVADLEPLRALRARTRSASTERKPLEATPNGD